MIWRRRFHFFSLREEKLRWRSEEMAIFGELFEGAGGAFMINDVDDETFVGYGAVYEYVHFDGVKDVWWRICTDD